MVVSDWFLFHTFRRLANEGKVRHLSCPDDKNELTTLRGEDDEVILYCGACNSSIHPGLDLKAKVRAVVMEHTNLG